MSTTYVGVGAWLVEPGGAPFRIVSGRIASSMNGGLEWDVALAQAIPGLAGYGEEAEWTLVIADPLGGAPWSSPPLYLGNGTSGKGASGRKGSLAGTDKATHLLAAKEIHLPTYAHKTSHYVLGRLGVQAGVTVNIDAAAPNFRMLEYTVSGGNLAEHFGRIVRDSGCIYRVHGSAIEVLPAGYEGSNGRTLYISETEEGVDRETGYTQAGFRKTSRFQSVYKFPAARAGQIVGDITGGLMVGGMSVTRSPIDPLVIAYAAFYTGAGLSGELCNYVWWDDTYIGGTPGTVPTSSDPARSVVFKTLSATACELTLSGSIPDPYTGGAISGYDLTFERYYPTVAPAGRKKILTMESPLWQSQGFVASIEAAVLLEQNLGQHTVTRHILPDPWVGGGMLPGFIVPADADGPRMRADRLEISVTDGVPSMSLKGGVL